MSKLLLLDGNSLTYRAFFAIPEDMATRSGQPTGAVFGFTSMLINLVRDHRPDAIAVCFDRPEPTFRHIAAPEYKAHRDETPATLIDQLGLVREVLESLSMTALDCAGFEADDLLATLASEAEQRGDDVLIVSGDRDVYQLVRDPKVRVVYNRRGVTDYALYDEAGITERTGVTPDLYVQYAALRGDPSDNLPGVPGVGEKTAAKLLNKYGSLEALLAAAAEQTPKLAENLAAHSEHVRRNVDLMTLRTDAPVEAAPADLQWDAFDGDLVTRTFEFLEFGSLHARLRDALVGTALDGLLRADAASPQTIQLAETQFLPVDVGADARGANAVRLLAELADRDDPVALGYTLEADGAVGVLAVAVDPSRGSVLALGAADLEVPDIAQRVACLLGADGPGVHIHQAKALMRALELTSGDLAAGASMPGLATDTSIAAYLIHPSEGRAELSALLARHCGTELPRSDGQDQLGFDDLEVDRPSASVAAGSDALAVAMLAPALNRELEALGMSDLYGDIERPLICVLARMESAGIGVDHTELESLRDHLTSEVSALEAEVRQLAGRDDLNVNSPKQLAEVLFEDLGLTPQRKTKTGYSTSATALESLRSEHPIVDKLLAFREVEKLRSTYGVSLLECVEPDGRIHATFNQTVARTGRLSSEEPNLHNIPVRTSQGRLFRRAFVPADGYELLIADYNQIELRVIAHLSGDPGLVGAFEAGHDIHSATAASLFAISPSEVDPQQRSVAKMVSYGLAYGMEAYGLGQRLGVPTDEAAHILEAYFEAFPAVRSFMDGVVSESRERGYTETAFGRRRPLPELTSRNHRVRQAAERQAMNAPIQGLAADIFKVALVRLDAALRDRSAASRLVLQVHDEVILEVPPSERDEVTELTVDTMRHAADLAVPLEVHVSAGASWADAKG
ncbi:DNA polymerase I [Candidatus Poriferisodalis sp.]|uniref:DNA polymerase I n=1 Tax=Candidatus Poriferisodalis sp. TaxID=3101277 RepID=UPI003B51D4E7